MIVVNIAENNIEALGQLMVKLWPECLLKDEIANCKRILNSENETCILIKNDSDYIGFIYMSIRSDYVEGATSSPVAYIEGIYVKPEFQRSGIGRKLVAHGEDWGKQKGYTQIGSDTEIKNQTSIGFHLKNGFREANRIVCFLKEI